MRKILSSLLAFVIFSGCAGNPEQAEDKSHGGKIVGATGGALGAGAMAYSSAGLLCTIGGPLCAIVIIPAAIIGALVGGAAGSVVDAIGDAKRKDPAPPQDAALTKDAAVPPRVNSAAHPDG
jgi:hypothetical protein